MKKILRTIFAFIFIFSYFLPTIQVFADTMGSNGENNNVRQNSNVPKIFEVIDVSYVNSINTIDCESDYSSCDIEYTPTQNELSITINNVLTPSDVISGDTYYVYKYINGLLVGLDELTDTELLSLDEYTVDFNKYTNGSFIIDFIITRNDEEVTAVTEINFNYSNSSVVLSVSDFDISRVMTYGEELDLYVNYVALSQTEKEALRLALDTEEYIIDIVEALIARYNDVFIFDMLLSYISEESNYKLNYSSLTTVNNNPYNTIIGLEAAIASNNEEPLTVWDIRNDLFNGLSNINDWTPSFSLEFTDKNGDVLGNDDYIGTGTIMNITIAGITRAYEFMVLGDLDSDGYLDMTDINDMISFVLGMSTLPEIYMKAINPASLDNSNINLYDISNFISKYNNVTGTIDNMEILELSISSNLNNVKVGDTFEVSLSVSGITNNTLSGLQGLLKYDPSIVSLEGLDFVDTNSDWIGRLNTNSADSVNFGRFIYTGLDTIDSDSSILVFRFKAINEGTANIVLDETLASLYGEIVPLLNNNLAVNVNIARALSSNANIKELEVSVGKLNPNFNSNTTDYTIYVPYGTDNITISGKLDNEYASTGDFKTYNLPNDTNDIKITVTAEDGTVKVYNIKVVKQAISTYNNNNYLNSLEIEGYVIEFNKYTFNYNITVPYDVNKLDLSYITSDSDATVEVIGNESLKVGDNEVLVIVTAPNGEKRVYTINVTREKDDTLDTGNPNLGTDSEKKDENSVGRVIMIVLIIAAIIGLIYLLFKKDNGELKLR